MTKTRTETGKLDGIAVILVREDERLDQSGGGGSGEMWSDSGYS